MPYCNENTFMLACILKSSNLSVMVRSRIVYASMGEGICPALKFIESHMLSILFWNLHWKYFKYQVQCHCLLTTCQAKLNLSLYGKLSVCPPVCKIIHLLKLVDYPHIQADNPWYNYSLDDGFITKFYFMNYGKCTKIMNTSCLPKRPRQTVQTAPKEAVWSEFSLFAILTSISWIPALITNILFQNRTRKVFKIKNI